MTTVFDFLKKLADIPSVSGKESSLQFFLREELTRLGFRVRLQEAPPQHLNLIAERGEGGLLFTSNLNVFPFLSVPWEFSLEKDWVLGSGVLMPKGQIAALLKALSLTQKPVKIAFLAGNEGKGEGARNLNVQAEGAVVLRPTNLKPCWRGGGVIEAELKALGREANSACWSEGISALQLLLEAVDKLKVSPVFSRHYFSYGRSSINIVYLKGGGTPGVVPGEAEGLIEIPIYPPSPVPEILKTLENVCFAKRVSLKINKLLLPFESSKKNKVTQATEQAWKEEFSSSPSWSFYPSWSEASSLVAQNVPSIILGAGNLSLAHTKEEGVGLEELERLSSLLVKIIDFFTGAT